MMLGDYARSGVPQGRPKSKASGCPMRQGRLIDNMSCFGSVLLGPATQDVLRNQCQSPTNANVLSLPLVLAYSPRR